MGKERQLRVTGQTVKVLGALMSSPTDQTAGSEIAAITKLQSGTLYPILFRLEEAGWIESSWEDGDPHLLGRPRKRFYSVTAFGVKQTNSAFQEIRLAIEGLAWG